MSVDRDVSDDQYCYLAPFSPLFLASSAGEKPRRCSPLFLSLGRSGLRKRRSTEERRSRRRAGNRRETVPGFLRRQENSRPRLGRLSSAPSCALCSSRRPRTATIDGSILGSSFPITSPRALELARGRLCKTRHD